MMIRLPKRQRGKAWRAMIEIGPVTLIAPDPIYIIMPTHVQLLKKLGISFEIVESKPQPMQVRRHGTADLRGYSPGMLLSVEDASQL